MTQLAARRDGQLRHFSGHARQFPSNGHPWLDRLRQAGIDRFEQAGLPTTRDEEWRFTNVAGLAKIPFEFALPDYSQAPVELVNRFTFGNRAFAEVVLVNGHYSAELSKVGKLPRGVTIASLPAVLKSNPALLEQHLARYADIEKDALAALNTGYLRDGVVIHLAKGTLVKHPIHVIIASTTTSQPAAAHPRILVVAEDHVQATVVESYVGTDGGTYLTNAVTEVVAGDNTHIDHYKLQQEGGSAYHIASMVAQLGRDTRFVSHSVSIGGKLTRNDLVAVLNGENGYATLNGLVLAGGEQHVDNHTLLRHEKPHCRSHELYKHVLDGRASGVFKGRIFVQKDAQKTDSKQTSKSLLLSDDATMNAMPALEIYADDVKCTHGSTTGPVDEDMVFYLRSRGVPLEAARHLLTYAFAADITRRIKVEPVRRRIEDFMATQHGLPQDLRITDLGAHDEAAL